MEFLSQYFLDKNFCILKRFARALTEDAKFEGANVIARISGCSLGVARNLMKNLPETLPVQLYKHQAQRLVLELGKAQVVGYLLTS